MKKRFKPFVILSIITILPVIISSILYFNHASFHLKTLNKGTLVKPLVDVNDLDIGKQHKKLWRIVYIANENCDSSCKNLSFQLTQMTKILNKDRNRTIAITMQGPYLPLKNKFHEVNFVETGKIYLIDPLGNLFMYYPDSMDAMNVMKDLKRVLEVSQIG